MSNHTPRSRTPGKRNSAGSKIARQFVKHTGTDWKGEVFHGGELTKANNKRAELRALLAYQREVAYDNDEITDASSSRHYPQPELEAA